VKSITANAAATSQWDARSLFVNRWIRPTPRLSAAIL